MPRSAIGIDIGSRSVTVAEVRHVRGGPVVTNFGGVDLPADADQHSASAVGAAVRGLLSSAGIRRRRAWLGLTDPRVIVREIDCAQADRRTLRRQARYVLGDNGSDDVDDMNVDVHVAEVYQARDGQRRCRCIVVAAQRDAVERLVACARQAGVRVRGVDLDAFSVIRSVGSQTMLAPGEEVVVDVGATTTGITFHKAGRPTAVRVLAVGSDAITRELVGALDADWAAAEARKRSAHVGSDAGVTNRIVTEQARSLIDEIRHGIDEVRAQRNDSRVGRIVLTGGGATLSGLVEGLEAAMDIPTSIGNPFHRFSTKRSRYGPDDLARVGPALAAAIGHALAGVGQR